MGDSIPLACFLLAWMILAFGDASAVHCTPRENIIFLRTHKTGSTTLVYILDQIISRYNLTRGAALGSSTFCSFTPFKRCMLQDTWGRKEPFNVVYDHAVLNEIELEAVVGPNPVKVTLLRNPETQIQSLWHFARHLLKSIGRISMDLPMWPISNTCDLKSYLAGKFCLPGLADYLAFNNQAGDLGINRGIDDKDLKHLLPQLDTYFDLVLINERLDESLILLKEIFCLNWTDILYTKRNVFGASVRPVLSSEELRKLKDLQGLDSQVYGFFVQKLQARVREYGLERMKRDLKHFRGLLETIPPETDPALGNSMRMQNAARTINDNRMRAHRMSMEDRRSRAMPFFTKIVLICLCGLLIIIPGLRLRRYL